MGDIVPVNGKPAKGVLTERQTQLYHAINPIAGQAIADTVRQNLHERFFKILKPDCFSLPWGGQRHGLLTAMPGAALQEL